MTSPRRPHRPRLPALVAALATAAAAASLTACEADDAGPPVVALLVPGGADRWEDVDVPALGAAVAEGCADCEVVVYDAEADPARQSAQVEEAVEAGADALVLAAVDPSAGGALVTAAGGVPVVAYEHALPGAEQVVAPDRTALGRVQAEAALAALPERPRGRALVVAAAGGGPGAEEQVGATRSALEEAGLAVDVV